MVFNGQVDRHNEVCSITGISFPHSVDRLFSHFTLSLVVGIHLGLQLGYEVVGVLVV